MISWISLEEASGKYGIAVAELPAWLEKESIPCIDLNGTRFTDEGRLVQHLAYRQWLHEAACSIPENPSASYERSVLQLKNELLFHLHLMNPETPLHRLFTDELRWLISNDDERDIFNYVIYPAPHLYALGCRRGYTYADVDRIYRKCIRNITRKLQLLKRCRHLEMICKYELRAKNRLIDRYEEELARLKKPGRKGKQPLLPEDAERRLSAPLEELDLSTRVLTGCRMAGLATLGDLLWKGRNEGLTSLISPAYFGWMSFRKLVLRLQALNILDADGNSDLFPYLNAWKSRLKK